MGLFELLFYVVLGYLLLWWVIHFVRNNTHRIFVTGYLTDVKPKHNNVNLFSAKIICMTSNNQTETIEFEFDREILYAINKLKYRQVVSLTLKKQLFSKPLAIELIT